MRIAVTAHDDTQISSQVIDGASRQVVVEEGVDEWQAGWTSAVSAQLYSDLSSTASGGYGLPGNLRSSLRRSTLESRRESGYKAAAIERYFEYMKIAAFSLLLSITACNNVPSPLQPSFERSDAVQPVVVLTDSQYGNGIVVSSRPGRAIILTCRHVVFPPNETPQNLHIRTFTSESEPKDRPADVIATDSSKDLALLEVATGAVQLPSATLCSSESPIGEYERVTISLHGNLTRESFFSLTRFQPGQSGSPLFKEGKLVGLVQGNIGPGQGIQGTWSALADLRHFLRLHLD